MEQEIVKRYMSMEEPRANEGRILWLREFYPEYYEKLEWMLPDVKSYT